MLSTATKVQLASALASTLVRLGFDARRRIRRRGISFEVDIREGIDLSLFLFGSFQRHVTDLIRRFVSPDGVVIDIGANIGAVTLPVAAYLTSGRVIAFEPTDYAFAKLQTNLELNPPLAARVSAIQMFVGESSAPTSGLVAYSSWPVAGDDAIDKHPVHKGVVKDASCGQTSLDDYVSGQQLSTVSLIKIDTDGNEFAVLSGATQCLAAHRPLVIFEACAYLMVKPGPVFEDFAELFAVRDYLICWGARLTPMTSGEFGRVCPAGGGLDLIAVPREQHAHLRDGRGS
jgi:FkbM family methyltransferase